MMMNTRLIASLILLLAGGQNAVAGFDMDLAYKLAIAANCSYEIGNRRQTNDTDNVHECLRQYPEYGKVDKDKGLHAWHSGNSNKGIDGYYLVDTGKELILAIRGTQSPGNAIASVKDPENIPHEIESILADWWNDIFNVGTKQTHGPTPDYHKGFLETWGKIAKNLKQDKPQNLIKTLGGKPFYVTGHSKGGAVAVIADIELSTSEKLFGKPPDAVYTFEAARAITEQAKSKHEKVFANLYRFEYKDDIVPFVPPTRNETDAVLDTLPKLESLAGKQALNLLANIARFSFLSSAQDAPRFTADIGQAVYVAHDGSLQASADHAQTQQENVKKHLNTVLVGRLSEWAGELKLGHLISDPLQAYVHTKQQEQAYCQDVFGMIDDHVLYWQFIKAYQKKKPANVSGDELKDFSFASCCVSNTLKERGACMLDRNRKASPKPR